MKLSKNLSLAEVFKSATATRRGINNYTEDKTVLDNLKLLADNIFQPIRDHFNKPIFVVSGYRCELLNRAVGGATSSQHKLGQAIDIDQDGRSKITNAEVFNYIKDNLEFDQLIWEFGTDENPDWVHVSYSNRHRKQILKATKVHGRTKYKIY